MKISKDNRFEFVCAMISLTILIVGGILWAINIVTDGALPADWYRYEYETNLVLSFVFFGFFLSGIVGSLFSLAGIIKFAINNARRWGMLAINVISPVVAAICLIISNVYEAKLPNF